MFTRLIPAAIALLSSTATATQSFSNKGTRSGWDSFSIDSGTQGSVQEVSNVFLEGPAALKATQTYLGTSYTGRYHAEAVHNNGYHLGQETFTGFSFRLQQDWDFSGDQSYNIAQWIADFTNDNSCGEDWMPSSMIWVRGNTLYSRVKFGSVCDQHITEFPLTTVSGGTWYSVIVQANWQSDSSGYYKIWVNGNKVLEKYNIATMIDDGREFSFRVGLYANGWHDQKKLEGSQGTRQVWVDEVAIGSAYADVDPAQWNKKREVEFEA